MRTTRSATRRKVLRQDLGNWLSPAEDWGWEQIPSIRNGHTPSSVRIAYGDFGPTSRTSARENRMPVCLVWAGISQVPNHRKSRHWRCDNRHWSRPSETWDPLWEDGMPSWARRLFDEPRRLHNDKSPLTVRSRSVGPSLNEGPRGHDIISSRRSSSKLPPTL